MSFLPNEEELMRTSRFSEAQIIGLVQEHEARGDTDAICRRHGVRRATLCRWTAKYGGMDVSEAQRLRDLEAENARLKRLLAEAMLDVAALKDVVSRKG